MMDADPALQKAMEQAVSCVALGFAARVALFRLNLACVLRTLFAEPDAPDCNACDWHLERLRDGEPWQCVNPRCPQWLLHIHV